MTISMQEVRILIVENALESMELSALRKRRDIQRQMDDLDQLENDIRATKFEISSMRDAWLRGGCV